MWLGKFAASVLLVFCLPAIAAGALVSGGVATVTAVVDGDTVVLDDGRKVRLVGIQTPKLPLGRSHVKLQPLAHEAKAALEELTLNQPVRLSYGGRRSDRHGRELAHLHTPGGVWVQGDLLLRGLARVYSFRDNRSLIGDMLLLEREARRARRGIWDHEFYRVRGVEETPGHLDTFQLVEGRVVDAAEVRGRTYLNFGEDWRSDFTVSISSKDRRQFRDVGFDLLALSGERIRVRGWLYHRNGPMIDVTHPEQIEVLQK